VLVALVVGLGMWLLVNRTAFGVLASLAGRNPTMVKWQGARVLSLGLTSFLISGALAGLSGVIEVFGPNGRLVGGFLPTHGFTAILIALVANLSIAGIAVVGLFFGALASAALYLPIMAGLPSAAIDIINAAIALFITAKPEWVDRLLRFGRAPS
jgi:simple sugar transport system permease protein